MKIVRCAVCGALVELKGVDWSLIEVAEFEAKAIETCPHHKRAIEQGRMLQ
jgi:hypothetical protein